MIIQKIITSFFLLSSIHLNAEQLFVNPSQGNDLNAGTETLPLKTINEAAHRINSNHENGSSEIILSPGTYLITTTVLFDNNKYNVNQRLVIRASVMPDDAEWSPQKMPVLITLVPLHPGPGGEEGNGLQIEVSHVTIKGLKITGSPDYTYKNEKEIRRSYPIWRGGKSLDDLVVTQCLFVGNANVSPLHVGVIANGQGLVIDHCVFYNCKNPVVFWKADGGISNRNAMRNCLVYGSYFSGVWTTSNTNGNDFDFRNNIISNCKNGWIREVNSTNNYTVHNSIFTDNTVMAGFGSGPLGNELRSDTTFLKFDHVIFSGKIQIEMDQSKRNYLQLVNNSFGSDLGAGLFINNNPSK